MYEVLRDGPSCVQYTAMIARPTPSSPSDQQPDIDDSADFLPICSLSVQTHILDAISVSTLKYKFVIPQSVKNNCDLWLRWPKRSDVIQSDFSVGFSKEKDRRVSL